MKKKKIRLTESQLHDVISRSIKSVLREGVKPNADPKAAWNDVDDSTYNLAYATRPSENPSDDPMDRESGVQYDIELSISELIEDIVNKYNISLNRAADMVFGRLSFWRTRLRNIDQLSDHLK